MAVGLEAIFQKSFREIFRSKWVTCYNVFLLVYNVMSSNLHCANSKDILWKFQKGYKHALPTWLWLPAVSTLALHMEHMVSIKNTQELFLVSFRSIIPCLKVQNLILYSTGNCEHDPQVHLLTNTNTNTSNPIQKLVQKLEYYL